MRPLIVGTDAQTRSRLAAALDSSSATGCSLSGLRAQVLLLDRPAIARVDLWPSPMRILSSVVSSSSASRRSLGRTRISRSILNHRADNSRRSRRRSTRTLAPRRASMRSPGASSRFLARGRELTPQVANETMARPIRALTEARGYSTAKHILTRVVLKVELTRKVVRRRRRTTRLLDRLASRHQDDPHPSVLERAVSLRHGAGRQSCRAARAFF